MRTQLQEMIRSTLTLAIVSTFLVASEARAAEEPGASPVTVGTKVRILAPTVVAGRVEGTVAEMDAKSLLISVDNGTPVRVSRQAITQLEVSTGRHRKALKGMIIGAGIGAVVFQLNVSNNCQNSIGSCTTSHAAAAGVGALAGGAWGAGIGALFSGDRWSAVPLERVRVSLAPTPGRGVALALSVGF
jgi:hypothetical protein